MSGDKCAKCKEWKAGRRLIKGVDSDGEKCTLNTYIYIYMYAYVCTCAHTHTHNTHTLAVNSVYKET